MKKQVFWFITLLIVIIAAVGLVLHFTRHKTEPATASHQSKKVVKKPAPFQTYVSTLNVYIVEGAFGPASLNIPVNDTVIWKNLDAAPHSIVFDKSPVPVGPSPALARTQTYSLKFTTPGDYTYHDGLNSSQKGSVTVK